MSDLAVDVAEGDVEAAPLKHVTSQLFKEQLAMLERKLKTAESSKLKAKTRLKALQTEFNEFQMLHEQCQARTQASAKQGSKLSKQESKLSNTNAQLTSQILTLTQANESLKVELAASSKSKKELH
jgi:chromosome segregation ATPase